MRIYAIYYGGFMDKLFERIQKEADKNGITGKKLGELLGLKKSPMTDWKNGRSIPTTEHIIKMCDIFAVSADYMLFGLLAPTNLSDDEILLLKLYKELPNEEKEEFIAILQIIHQKVEKREKRKIKSSPSKDTNETASSF